MPLTLIHSSEAQRAPAEPGVLGYLYNHGGLNNQKMALVSLMLKAMRQGMAINLPYIHNRDQTTREEFVVPIAEVFDVERILAFGQRHGLPIQHACPSGDRGGWDFFREFNDLFELGGASGMETLRACIDALQPWILGTPAFRALAEKFENICPGGTVLQLRIENDWLEHLRNVAEIHPELEGLNDGYPVILKRIRTTFPELERAYVVADEKSLSIPKSEVMAVALDQGLDLVWKSDLLPPGYCDAHTPLELSIIDFAIAKRATRFVGHSLSTFAGMISFERFVETCEPVRGHFRYDVAGDRVLERTDNGFHNASRLMR